MTRTALAVIFAAGLLAAPLPLRAQTPAPAPMQSAAPAEPAKAETKTKTRKAPTAGQLAARERAKKCGAEWKAAKAAGKIEKGQKWPQFWSACNKRLKGAS